MQPIRLQKFPQGEFLAFSQDTADYQNQPALLEETRPFEILVSLAKKYRPFQRDIVHVGSYTGIWAISQAKKHADLTFHMLEIQRMAHYAACGNIALHNTTNTKASLIGIGLTNTMINLPIIDYTIPASYREFDLSLSTTKFALTRQQDQIPLIHLDSLRLSPLLIKMDVSHNLEDLLKGGKKTIEEFQPIIISCSHKPINLEAYLEYSSQYLGTCTTCYLPKWIKHVSNLQHMLDRCLDQAVPTCP